MPVSWEDPKNKADFREEDKVRILCGLGNLIFGRSVHMDQEVRGEERSWSGFGMIHYLVENWWTLRVGSQSES